MPHHTDDHGGHRRQQQRQHHHHDQQHGQDTSIHHHQQELREGRPWIVRKRIWLVLLLLSAALMNPINPMNWGGPNKDHERIWDPNDVSELTPDQRNNRTFKQNPFFADQLLFTNASLLNELAGLFVPAYFEPNTVVLRKGIVPDFFVIQNGSCYVQPGGDGKEDDGDVYNYVDNFHAGDSLGGLNLMYGRVSMHNVRATSSGMVAWRADRNVFREFLDRDLLLAGAFERKFLRSRVEKHGKRPLIFFPGFASTQLVAWKPKKCVGLSIDVGERVWLDVVKVLHHNVIAERCFVNCMSLDMMEQTDPPDCKLRPEEGVNAIYDLAGGIFAPFTTIFRPLVLDMARKFGYDITSLVAIPYDWRLAPSLLQDRDHLFTRIKQQIEQAVSLNRNPGITICHSMGCNVFHYFIEFMKVTYPNTWKQWVDKHLWMHLGFMSGISFSLPMDIADVRLMGKTWSSGYWLLPFNISAPSAPLGIEPFSQWPETIVTLLVDENNPKKNVSFSIHDITSGQMFADVSKWLFDDDFIKFRHNLHRLYHNNTMYNPIKEGSSGPSRPPVRKVVAVYGVNLPTEIGFQFRIGTVHDKSSTVMKDEIYETAGGQHMVKHASLGFLPSMRAVGDTKPLYTKSGDGVVPYVSLSFANSWHYGNVTKTHSPATSRVDVDMLLTILGEATNMRDQVLGIKRNLNQSNWMQLINVVEPAFTKYTSVLEDTASDDPYEVTVIEVESVTHRDVIRDSFILKQIEEELYYHARAIFLRHHPTTIEYHAESPANDASQPTEAFIGPIASIESLLRTFSSHTESALSKLFSLIRQDGEGTPPSMSTGARSEVPVPARTVDK